MKKCVTFPLSLLMLNPDSEWGDLGGYYGFILSAVN